MVFSAAEGFPNEAKVWESDYYEFMKHNIFEQVHSWIQNEMREWSKRQNG